MSAAGDPALPLQFRERIADRLGLRFDEARLDFLGEVLQRRAEARGVAAEAYLGTIGEDASETGALAEELTVGETYFFRDGDQFRALGEIVLPELLQRMPPRPVNVLSAGCSSGEEAYTVAMVADAAGAGSRVSIRAVDINPAALRKAAAGRYSNWSLRETPPEIRTRWFTPHGRDMVLREELRRVVHFEPRNLVDADSDIWRPQAYDVVFCRNVIMYFAPALQRTIVARIAESLAPGGYLFLGHAEALRGLSEAFLLVQSHGTFFHELKPGFVTRRPRRRAAAGKLEAPAPAELLPEIDAGWYEAIASSSRRIESLSRSAQAAPSAALPAAWDIENVLDLLRRERFAEALALVGEAPAELAVTAPVQLLQATLLVQDGRLDAAAESCRALLDGGTLEAEAHHVLALCYEGRGRSEDALRCYGLAVQGDSLFAMPRLRAGILARRSGRLEEARGHLGAAADLLERETDLRLLLFGGGFARAALLRLCAAELRVCEVAA